MKHKLSHPLYRHRSLGQLACVKSYRRTQIFDLFLAREEYQHISCTVTGVDLKEGTQGRLYKVRLTGQCVEYVYVVLPPPDIDRFGTEGIA